jgi:hypothetical protein
LTAAKEVLGEKMPIILLEFNDQALRKLGSSTEELSDQLGSLGYLLFLADDHPYSPTHRKLLVDRSSIFSPYPAIRKSTFWAGLLEIEILAYLQEAFSK